MKLHKIQLDTTIGDGTCFYDSMARIFYNSRESTNDLTNVKDALQDIAHSDEETMAKAFITSHAILHLGEAYQKFHTENKNTFQSSDRGIDWDEIIRVFLLRYRRWTASKPGKNKTSMDVLGPDFREFLQDKYTYADEPQIRSVLQHPKVMNRLIVLIVTLDDKRFDPTTFLSDPNNTFECLLRDTFWRPDFYTWCTSPDAVDKRFGILVRTHGRSKGRQDERMDVHYQPVFFHIESFVVEASKRRRVIEEYVSIPVRMIPDIPEIRQLIENFVKKCVKTE